jgi:hypothetical protein
MRSLLHEQLVEDVGEGRAAEVEVQGADVEAHVARLQACARWWMRLLFVCGLICGFLRLARYVRFLCCSVCWCIGLGEDLRGLEARPAAAERHAKTDTSFPPLSTTRQQRPEIIAKDL